MLNRTDIVDMIIIAFGVISFVLLFYKMPVIRKSPGRSFNAIRPKVSIVIPCRNEEHNLPRLLGDIARQDTEVYEVICVDDDSQDRTVAVAQSRSAIVIDAGDKPDDWLGKSWACQKGAEAAGGEILLFLDADVRLKPEAVSALLFEMQKSEAVVSVQPYHKVVKLYEQFSLIFNLVLLAANSMGKLYRKWKIGLCGPAIMISCNDYFRAGGHSSVRTSIVDDIALGASLKEHGIAFENLTGGDLVSFRMYPSGIRELYQGWTKNMSSGAVKTHILPLLSVFLWITSLASVSINLIVSIFRSNTLMLIFSIVMYLVWVCLLFVFSRKTGSFSVLTILFYPVVLAFFIALFIVSVLRRIFRKGSVWKGRKIKNY